MDPTDLGMFHLAEQRLAWTDRRQKLLAQNVANANTPGYRPRDARPFEDSLRRVALAATSPLHLLGTGGANGDQNVVPRQRAPDGNAVSLEDELRKIADTSSLQALTLNLHHKYQSMIRISLGLGA